ncbi:MAG: hypothetical protein KatS3mg035_0622 [Bacteroidia bacterium]|nr:MAG: hypothetical protein KatS3mg035_0622 [Bacteroidia bacterium]
MYQHLPSLGTEIWKELKLYFKNSTDSLQRYYESKKVTFTDKTLKLNAEILNINPLFDFWEQKIFVARNTKLDIAWNYFQNIQLDLSLQSDSIFYHTIKTYHLGLSTQVIKNQFANDWNVTALCQSDSLKVGDFKISDLSIQPSIKGNILGLDFAFQQNQPNLNNRVHWIANGKIDTLSYLQIDHQNSITQLGNTQWAFNPENKIVFKENFFAIENLQINYQEEFYQYFGRSVRTKKSYYCKNS